MDASRLPDIAGIDGVMAGNNRFLAMGYRCSGPRDPTYGTCPTSNVLLTSDDGVRWQLVGDVPGFVYEDSRGMFSEGDSHLTSTSSTIDLVWSPDGTNWTSLSDEPAFASGACHTGDDFIYGFYPIGDALFAIGSAAWSSLDGQTWRCIGAGLPQLRFSGGHDLLLGSGDTDPSSPNDYMWMSQDGLNWQRTAQTPDFMTAAPVAKGFVALGQSFNSAPGVLLTSADGISWTPEPVPFGDEILNENGKLQSDGSRVAIVEDASDATAESPGDLWVSSRDGATWTRYPLPRRRSDYAQYAAIVGNRVVVAGQDESHNSSDGHELIWTATLPN